MALRHRWSFRRGSTNSLLKKQFRRSDDDWGEYDANDEAW